MSLATKCPHCRTTFKVANDQLKLQAGLVRCGLCQRVFSGTEHLVKLHEEASQEQHDAQADLSDIEKLPFIRQANAKKSITWLFSIGTLILAVLLVGQMTYQLRNILAAIYPPSKPTLVKLCSYLHCQIQLPTQIDALRVDADQLHTLSRPNTFEFNLLLLNRSALVQAWPYIELTLKNVQKQTVLRRVFTPADYMLDTKKSAHGFSAHQEQAVNMYFKLAQVTASDYSVAIFYP